MSSQRPNLPEIRQLHQRAQCRRICPPRSDRLAHTNESEGGEGGGAERAHFGLVFPLARVARAKKA